MAEPTSTVTLSVTAQEANLLLLAAARFAIPMRGNAASVATVGAIVENADRLTEETRAQIANELRNQAYSVGDPWTDMDSAFYLEAAELLSMPV